MHDKAKMWICWVRLATKPSLLVKILASYWPGKVTKQAISRLSNLRICRLSLIRHWKVAFRLYC